MKLSIFKDCKSSFKHAMDYKCPKPQPDQLIEFDFVENKQQPKQEIRLSAESKISEEVRYSKQSAASKSLSLKQMLNDSTDSKNTASKFGSLNLSQPNNSLFPHKCNQNQDEYLTCQCPKFPNQKCSLPYCVNNCISFKCQLNPSLYQQEVRGSAKTSSGVSGSLKGSDYFCEIPVGKRTDVKLTKNMVCQCEAGGCRNGKCPCKRNQEFCDVDVCDCRECKNMMAVISIGKRLRNRNSLGSVEERNKQLPEKIRQQSSMEQENCPEFEEMNFFLHLKKQQASMMDEEK